MGTSYLICYSKNLRKTLEKKKKIEKRTYILLLEFSVSACAKELPGFYTSGTSTPNVLFQTINFLKRLMRYFTANGFSSYNMVCCSISKLKSWTILLTIKIRSLLNCLPYVLPCQRLLHVYMLTCQRTLHAYVLMC